MRKSVSFLLFLTFAFLTTAVAQDDFDARDDTAKIATLLGDRDPVTRRRAAETLANLAAVDQKKMIEGYRLQEKDKRVRLALDWALYRIGKTQSLYDVVQDLDSSRYDQAVGYLVKLDSADSLNGLLKRYEKQPRITAGVIAALGQIGDSNSLDLIKPFRDSYDKGVAAAAERSVDQIEKRLTETETATTPGRPRTVSTAEKSSP